MKRFTAPVLAGVIVAVSSPSLSAQWLQGPSPAVSQGSAGTGNLTAPTPRTPDGTPDLSGIWNVSPRREKPGQAPPGRPPLAVFADIGVNMVGGLPSQRWAADLSKKRVANRRYDNPDALCLPQGPLQYHLDPQPRQIHQMPGRTLVVYESNYGLRTIYTDGRRLPKLGEPQPYWHGYSVGRWEGATFVVESNNFRGVQGGHAGDGWLDQMGSPFTDALHLTERFRRVNVGNMEIDVTIDDPKAYTRPFTVRVEHVIDASGFEMIEFICHENQKFLEMTGRAPRR
ncbi:MAG: hypothetical protein A3I61_12220 [Acidobacteria bacterium RIFCSPLOWO2_02_FULL_68_18]|nr:MAG: hypothetical protein A3I61_12220 [Acidobacteria bacterium RIFCSPLOWO2_02_FULL_68_18]